MSFSSSNCNENNMNQKNLLCKKMNINCKDINCLRSHSFDELIVTKCIYDTKCKNHRCPFIHSNDSPITKEKYYNRMYEYINPYDSYKTSICRYYKIGCKVKDCRKAHSIDELNISECDCYRDDCTFYHKYRDENITKEEYFERMKNWSKIFDKSDKKLLCRYINIGCKRTDCPYAHSIKDLKVHKCIFSDCKNTCVFLHKDETIDKQEYFERMLHHIQPFKPNTILCSDKEYCTESNCKYAHNYSNLIVSECVRGNSCKKHCCPFKHPYENLSKTIYYNRMVISKFPN